MVSYHRPSDGGRAPRRIRGAVGPSTLAIGIALALGQPAAAQNLEQVTVTGSRIQRTSGFTTAVPVTAVTAEDLNSFRPGTTTADQLDQLPQFYETESAQRGGGALFGSAGRSSINMRALGANRTLVLLDGARLSPADRDGLVHVDNIPTALLSQIEVVTGGASAAYGADALAGVTNFRLNREFTGLNLDVGVGTTDFGDGDQNQVSLAYGTDIGDRLHFIGSLQSHEIGQIRREPDEGIGSWFRRWGHVENPAWTAGDTSVPRRLTRPDVHSTVHTPTGRIRGGYDAAGTLVPGFGYDGLQFTYDGEGVQPFAAGDVVGAGTGSQAGGPEAYLANLAFETGLNGAEVVNQSYFAGLTFDANDTTRIWANVLGGKTESNVNGYRDIPHLTNPWYARLYSTNPFLPEALRQEMIDGGVDSIIVEKQGSVIGQDGNWGDHVNDHNQFDGWTLQLGVDRELGGTWSLQARVQRGETDRFTTTYNATRVDREFVAIDAVEIYPDARDLDMDGLPDLVPLAETGTGQIVCNVQRYNPTPAELQAAVAGYVVPAPQGDASLGGPEDLVPIPGPIGPDNVIRDCTPMNVLGQGNVSREAANYVQSPKEGHGAVVQEFAEVLVTGDIADGIGAGPFGMAVGATWREQSFWQYGAPVELMAYGPPRNAPEIGIRGLPPGFSGGSANLHEFSTVPVISGDYDVWEAFVEFNLPLWEGDSGNRRFEIDVAGRYSDYSTSGGISANKIGVNWQVVEAFRIRATKSRDVREPTFAERFNLQGGGGDVDDPENGGNNFETTVTSGGNPDLAPEEADTITAGFVLTPPGAEGLQLSMDYYEIDLTGAVGQLGAQRIVDECFASGGASELCGLIRRDPNTTFITNIRNVFLNVNSATVRGMDYELLWNAAPDWFSGQDEAFNLRLLAGRQFEDSTTVSGGMPNDTSNAYEQPDFTALLAATYNIGDFGVRLQQRYIGPSILDTDWIEGVDVDDNTVESQTRTDLTLLYGGETPTGAAWQASLAITNLLDTEPPVIASFGQRFSSQLVPDNFDIYGRRYMLNFRYGF